MQFSCLLNLQAPAGGKWIKGSVAKGFLSQHRHLDHCAGTARSSTWLTWAAAASSSLTQQQDHTLFRLFLLQVLFMYNLNHSYASLTFFIVTVLVRIIVSILPGVLSSWNRWERHRCLQVRTLFHQFQKLFLIKLPRSSYNTKIRAKETVLIFPDLTDRTWLLHILFFLFLISLYGPECLYTPLGTQLCL